MNEPTFGAFDPDAEVQRTQRYLPHWFQPGVTTFVTFRTADSFPKEVVERRKRELEDWLQRHGVSRADQLEFPSALSPDLEKEYRKLKAVTWHRDLDACHGACVLRDPRNAQIVADSLLHFDGDRYDLDSFVVMPNHVHLLVQFRLPTTVRSQTESWLHYTAVRINRNIGHTKTFWQSEPFDHLVRNAEQFQYLQDYIAENPQKAKLVAGEYLYWTRQLN
jgi:REP element-mobilizing transposase RayT